MFRLIKPSSGLFFDNIKNTEHHFSIFFMFSIQSWWWLDQPQNVACFILSYMLCTAIWENISAIEISTGICHLEKNADFYRTWTFISVFTRARLYSLSWPCLIQCTHPPIFILVVFILYIITLLPLTLKNGNLICTFYKYRYRNENGHVSNFIWFSSMEFKRLK